MAEQIRYGVQVHIKSRYSNGSYLDTCGHAKCTTGTLYKVSTHPDPDRAGKSTGTWTIVSSTGSEGPVLIGDVVHIKNEYASGSYLDTCGNGKGASTTRYQVSTHKSKDRAGKNTAKWHVMSASGDADGTPLDSGTEVYLRNLYGSGSYLDVCGNASCAPGTLYNVVTDSGQDRAGKKTATWTIHPLPGATGNEQAEPTPETTEATSGEPADTGDTGAGNATSGESAATSDASAQTGDTGDGDTGGGSATSSESAGESAATSGESAETSATGGADSGGGDAGSGATSSESAGPSTGANSDTASSQTTESNNTDGVGQRDTVCRASASHTTGHVVPNAVRLLADTLLLPGSSLLIDGELKAGALHAVAGIAARIAVGPIGWLAVAANSYAKSATGSYLVGREKDENHGT